MNLDNIGKWKVAILETGDFWLDGGAMMGSVPKVLWSKTNPCDNLNRIQLALRCLLLDDGENVVLVETGIGDKNSEKFINMFNICQHVNALSNTLSEYGYIPEDITHVILTHLHFDHAGGATKFNSEGEVVPSFPNAQYFISNNVTYAEPIAYGTGLPRSWGGKYRSIQTTPGYPDLIAKTMERWLEREWKRMTVRDD